MYECDTIYFLFFSVVVTAVFALLNTELKILNFPVKWRIAFSFKYLLGLRY